MSLSKGLTEDQKETLERELKSSLLAKQLKLWLQKNIMNAELREEQLVSQGIAELASQVGQRRGYRTVLSLFPEG
tara:strand:- start:5991 stop:6215 length:225 start_codon:yes stop_codon:yes gene_type:complete